MFASCFVAKKIAFPGWQPDVDRQATRVSNTHPRLLLYRVSLGNCDIRKIQVWSRNFWLKLQITQEKKSSWKKDIFWEFFNGPKQCPNAAQKSSRAFGRPWAPKSLKNLYFFMLNLDFRLAFHGFPCQNFIPSSRHAYRGLNSVSAQGDSLCSGSLFVPKYDLFWQLKITAPLLSEVSECYIFEITL